MSKKQLVESHLQFLSAGVVFELHIANPTSFGHPANNLSKASDFFATSIYLDQQAAIVCHHEGNSFSTVLSLSSISIERATC